jgi:hypothetical protein
MDDTVFDSVQAESMHTDATMGSNLVLAESATHEKTRDIVVVPAWPVVDTPLEESTLVNDDDFDDDLELSDFDADDFDKIATTYEETIPVKIVANAAALLPQLPPEALDLVGEEDFGDDDMDEECFVQAEAAATQSYQESLSQNPDVRTWQSYR